MSAIRTIVFHCIAGLRSLVPFFVQLREVGARYTRTDLQWILLILVLAGVLRFPFLDHPANPQFDEVVYSRYAVNLLDGIPAFDIHPPLVRMLFAVIAQESEPFSMRSFPIPAFSNQPFLDFPYIPLRTTVAFFGTLLPLLLYGISRLLGATPRWAGLVALFVVIDPAFIVYSRAILPDTILLAVEMGALLAALAAVQSETTRGKVGFALLAALALGAAVSIKWIALSIVGVVGLLYLFHRRWKTILATGVVMAGVYVSSFLMLSLSFFPYGGVTDPLIPAYDVPWVRELVFPAHPSVSDALTTMRDWHEVSIKTNQNIELNTEILQAPGPTTWAVAKSSIIFWIDGTGGAIWLQGNALLWNLAFFLFLFEIGWIASQVRSRRVWPIDHTETILLLGYIGSYLPFFFINRPMFLYHYFLALLFLFLLVPKVAPRAIACLGSVTNDALFAKVFSIVILLLILVASLISFPVVYGF